MAISEALLQFAGYIRAYYYLFSIIHTENCWDGIVELALGARKVWRGLRRLRRRAEVAQRDIASQQDAPLLDFFEEFLVHLGGAAFAFAALREAVKGPVPDRFLGKNPRQLLPTLGVFFV